MIELRIRDNGLGLNWDQLNVLIKERNFVPEADQTLADVVFSEGVSTRKAITQTSGRGVGLAAIRQIAQKLKGDVHIKDRDDQKGCDLTLCFAK
jgi:chemotaxis protein histidine kinase CheA